MRHASLLTIVEGLTQTINGTRLSGKQIYTGECQLSGYSRVLRG
jgi:hypothetical protein